jgi:hypothetical protein
MIPVPTRNNMKSDKETNTTRCDETAGKAGGIKKDVSRNAVILPDGQPRWRPTGGKDARAFERHPAKPPPTFLF